MHGAFLGRSLVVRSTSTGCHWRPTEVFERPRIFAITDLYEACLSGRRFPCSILRPYRRGAPFFIVLLMAESWSTAWPLLRWGPKPRTNLMLRPLQMQRSFAYLISCVFPWICCFDSFTGPTHCIYTPPPGECPLDCTMLDRSRLSTKKNCTSL